MQIRYQSNKHNIDLRLKTRVLGPQAGRTLLLTHQNKLSNIAYDQLLLATGCHERSVPFPGWQLPGVMLMGGIQLQIKSNLVVPGTRIALVGTGALLVLIACQLHKSGVNVVGIYEVSSFANLAKEAVALMNQPQLTLSGLTMKAYLKRHGIEMHYGWGIVAAKGSDEVKQIEVAPYDAQWQADLTKKRSLDVDCVGVGYGFVSRSQLSMIMELDHEYLAISGLTPRFDYHQKSSAEGVYVAGDGAGLLGADGAMYEGRLAALAIANNLGKLSDADLQRKSATIHRRLDRIKRFRQGFDRFSTRKKGLLALPDPQTMICRCENVTKQAIDEAIAQGVRDITSLKMRTRVCMGDCQGKTCASYCYDRLQAEGYATEMGAMRPRFPLDPIPFAALED